MACGLQGFSVSGVLQARILECTGQYWLPYPSEVKWSEVTQSCPTLCDPMDCSLLRSSVHGIFQARVLEWIAIFFSRGSSWPRNQTQVSHTVGRRFTVWATREEPLSKKRYGSKSYMPTSMFIAALFTIAKTWKKSKYPSIAEEHTVQQNESGHTYTYIPSLLDFLPIQVIPVH